MTPDVRNTLVLMVMTHMQVTGDTLTRSCNAVGVSYKVYRDTVRASLIMQEMHDEAVGLAEDILADKLVNINEVQPDPKMAAVVSKNIQWFLARRRPDKYGDRITVQHETSRDKVIIERLLAAKHRALPPPNVEDAIEIPPLSERERSAILVNLGLDPLTDPGHAP